MFNNDLKYASTRIIGTFMLSSIPGKGLVKILEIIGKTNELDKATILVLNKEGGTEQFKITDLKFAVGRLGYINHHLTGAATYLSRVPVRLDYKQGLRAGQLAMTLRDGTFQNLREGFLETNIKPLSNCVLNKYPSLLETIEKVEEYNTPVAFSKNFAINKKYKLMYKEMVAGELTSTDKVKLFPEFMFLEQELIKEVGNENFSR